MPQSERVPAPTRVLSFRERVPAFLRSKYGPIQVVLVGAVVLGLMIAGDYGMSLDEYGDFKYGEDSVQAYLNPLGMVAHGDREYYGPFYLMAGSVASDVFRHLRPGWLVTDGRHLSNYLVFLAGVLFFYVLACRYVAPFPALAASLLFFTQPLLFGHSFINQKDIPFMAFFTASLALGLVASDEWQRLRGPPPTREAMKRPSWVAGLKQSVTNDWMNADWQAKALALILTALAGLVVFDLFQSLIILSGIRTLVQNAYLGNSWGWLNGLFLRVAQDAYKTPLSEYLEKVQEIYLWLRLPVAFLGFVPAMALGREIFTSTVENLGAAWFRTARALLVSGIMLGLCSSIRVAGPLAGGLVSLVFLARSTRDSVIPLTIYWVSACLMTYATWPFLWAAPFSRFWEAVRIMASFPGHEVLYDGQRISSGSLPWHYLPRLTAIQLTEPGILLTVVGIVLGLLYFWRDPKRRAELAVLWLWIGVPVVAVVLFQSGLYGNIRQVLFILPAAFIFAAIALSKVFKILRHRDHQLALVVLMLLPAIVGMIRLHPYEYIYYNSLVGGVDGAFGRYEIDPWCTSFKEATQYMNQIAADGAVVAVSGPENAGVATYAREDLVVTGSSPRKLVDFAIGCKRAIGDPDFFPDMKDIYEVTRGRAVLAVVKQAQ